MNKTISVIIPTYNQSSYIQESIESVFNSLDDLISEVLVIDDGSEDNTEAIVKKLKSKFPTIAYRKVEHRGRAPGAIRNIGLKMAKGKYIAFQDSDDIWTKDKLKLQLPLLENDTSLIAVYGNAQYINAAGQRMPEPIIVSRYAPQGNIFTHLLKVHRQIISTPTLIVRKTALEKVGGFNPDLPLASDIECWIKLAAIGNFAFVDSTLALIRRHETNISPVANDLEGVFLDRLNQIPVYRSVAASGLLSKLQLQQLKWAQVEVLDQLEALSGRYGHLLAKSYDGPNKTSLQIKRFLAQLRYGLGDIWHIIKNLFSKS